MSATIQKVDEHVVEIISDSGEGAQTAGQMFGTLCAKMGNGVWTVEIIPAEIEPPARSTAGASGNRIRIGVDAITNAGDEADLVIAFNEQVLLGREAAGEFRPGATIMLESKWREDREPAIVSAYTEAYEALVAKGYRVVEINMEDECRKVVDNPQRGKNIFVVGILSCMYSRDLDIVRQEIAKKFKKKGDKVIQSNLALLDAGYDWATEHL
ncbi:MAG: 2-oxoacid:acceptor oxidoreductase family protein, partial [Gammaproteobacteria bacterium]|nr:2-oxoacid:acceptor oxidoreductase family protein [Gammaproteobacteria bacterium]